MKNLALLWSAVLCWSASAWAEEIPTFTAVMENGPSENRINVVFLSEAYVASQRETYFSDVQIATDSLFNFTPFREYRNYFNAYAIWAASQDSFLAIVERGEEPRTYFGEWGGLSPSLEKIDQVIRYFISDNSPVISVVLINDDRETAAGSRPQRVSFIGLVSVGTGRLHHGSYTNRDYTRSFIHEFGHAFGDLRDEYNGNLTLRPGETERNLITCCGPFINVTTERNRDRIRWKHWIEPAVPIPTPVSTALISRDGVGYYEVQISDYADKVGLFEGAYSYDRGWYRSRLTCLMREVADSSGKPPPFCEVCREALVLEIYRQVDPTGEIGLKVGDTLTTFSIYPPAPLDHNLKIQWLVDGQPVSGHNITSLQVTDTGIGYGRHTVTVTVKDTTAWVRKDTVGFLVRAVEWRPTVYPWPDFSGDGVVDLDDFFMFADVFGRPKIKANENYDLDWDGAIDLNDFFLFADSFGQRVSESRISVTPAQ